MYSVVEIITGFTKIWVDFINMQGQLLIVINFLFTGISDFFYPESKFFYISK